MNINVRKRAASGVITIQQIGVYILKQVETALHVIFNAPKILIAELLNVAPIIAVIGRRGYASQLRMQQ